MMSYANKSCRYLLTYSLPKYPSGDWQLLCDPDIRKVAARAAKLVLWVHLGLQMGKGVVVSQRWYHSIVSYRIISYIVLAINFAFSYM